MAAVLAVAASPLAVADAGFILSFGATLGILLGAPVFTRGAAPGRCGVAGRAWRQVAGGVRALFLATACAEIALAPVGASLFARVPLAGLVLNFAAIPLMTLVQIGGLAVLAATAWWDTGARVAAVVAHLSAAGILESARLMDVAPWLALDVSPPVWWLVTGYYAAVLGWLAGGRRGPVGAAAALAAILVLAAPHPLTSGGVPRPAVPLRVVVLDVGQADATLVQLPGDHALLVDAAGVPWAPAAGAPAVAYDVGDRVVAPAIRALGVRRLTALVVTHGDPDHVQGAAGVLRRVAARSIWEGVPVPPHAGLQALGSLARTGQISWRSVQAGDAERFGEVEVRVLHPPPPEWERQRVRNDDSVVLELRVGNVSIVLPGDIGGEGERAIVPRLEPGRLVVLKAPHHGSATSSTAALLDRIQPAAVIFSCGRHNPFGHPHPDVVARYRARGAAVFSTAEDGAVMVDTDGNRVNVRGWTGRVARFPGATPP